MACPHCMRGDAEELSMDYAVIDRIFEDVRQIDHLVLTGGDDPAQRRHNGNQKKENGVSGGKLELAHDVLLKPGAPRGAPGGD